MNNKLYFSRFRFYPNFRYLGKFEFWVSAFLKWNPQIAHAWYSTYIQETDTGIFTGTTNRFVNSSMDRSSGCVIELKFNTANDLQW